MTTRETINKKISINKPRKNSHLAPIEKLKKGAKSWEKLARILYESIQDEADMNNISRATLKKISALNKKIPSNQVGAKSDIFKGSVKHEMAKLGWLIKDYGRFKTNIEAATRLAESVTPDINDAELTKRIAKNIAKRMSENPLNPE
jgi:hypothetical protein